MISIQESKNSKMRFDYSLKLLYYIQIMIQNLNSIKNNIIYTIICICTEIVFSRNSPYPRTPPGEGTDINRGLLMISIFRNCTFLEFLQNLHHSLKFSIVLFLSFPRNSIKTFTNPWNFPVFFLFQAPGIFKIQTSLEFRCP